MVYLMFILVLVLLIQVGLSPELSFRLEPVVFNSAHVRPLDGGDECRTEGDRCEPEHDRDGLGRLPEGHLSR